MQRRLKPFFKEMPVAEYKFLLGDNGSITLDDLKALLEDNELAGMDPVAEAFKVFDPSGCGYVDMDVLADLFRQIGFEELSRDDLRVLLEAADVDKDGKISLQDFRSMVDHQARLEEGLGDETDS